jgi:catechol 2,3-dioxygenase-like lactoylglutathione lyase family enzyme
MPEAATCPLPVPQSAIVPRLERRDVLAYSWPQSEEDPMAKIKHIAIATQDPEGTARFYTDVFGMKQIGRIDSPNVLGYFLSDGDINFAILKFKGDAAAGEERGKDWSGIHHFGFQVESLEAIAERLAQVGSQRRDDINNALGLGRTAQRNANVEVKYTAPDGVTVDVSETGWVGTPTFNPR